ncbi:UNVERIFIED_CONTAM: Oligopeptide transporter 3 [Sesamum calycinum]|uniref:Oligopeptide transporter 3 n=1 Tax=Sesamum calycinum TaxID=2727403 RepID=A0AAW2Q5V1_9LAMI
MSRHRSTAKILSELSDHSALTSDIKLALMVPNSTTTKPASNGEAPPEEKCSVEEVALVVPETDDPTLPVMTFRAWVLGLASCIILIFLNTFFIYRTQPLSISAILMQIGVLPIGKFMAATLPRKQYTVFGRWSFSLNPGPFNIKEHVIITVMANCGVSTGVGDAYSIGAITVMKAYYKQSVNFLCALLIVLTTQILGYGWAGMLRKYLVDPVEMWWPSNLAQVSLFRALHEKETKAQGMTRMKFFLIFMAASFTYYLFPGYLSPDFDILLLVWLGPRSITAQQIGSGYHGLGVGAFTLDWAGISAYHGSPLVTPFSSILNVMIGFIMFIYIIVPVCYWKFNTFDARKFPIFSNQLFTSSGHKYDTTKILTPQYELNIPAYEKYSKLYLSPLFALSIGSGFARFTATLTHVALFHGSYFRIVSCAKSPLIASGKPYLLFKIYGRISTIHALSFLADLKLGHYMKIPPRCMYTAQLVGTLVSGTVNLAVAWWMLGSIENICDVEALHPESPWTCPKFRVTFDSSVIWGLIGPEKLFGPGGLYRNLVWLFLIGAVLPVPIWILSKIFPDKKWIPLINIPVISYGFAGMPPATPTNIASWIITGTIFNYFVFKYRKTWWQRYNYVLSAALDAGTAFMGVLLFFALQNEGKNVHWWGTKLDHCPLASCPTAPGIAVEGCPVFR